MGIGMRSLKSLSVYMLFYFTLFPCSLKYSSIKSVELNLRHGSISITDLYLDIHILRLLEIEFWTCRNSTAHIGVES